MLIVSYVPCTEVPKKLVESWCEMKTASFSRVESHDHFPMFAGRGMFESTAAAKHVLAELKSAHMKTLRSKFPERRRIRKGLPISSVPPPELVPQHSIDTGILLTQPPDLCLSLVRPQSGRNIRGLPVLPIADAGGDPVGLLPIENGEASIGAANQTVEGMSGVLDLPSNATSSIALLDLVKTVDDQKTPVQECLESDLLSVLPHEEVKRKRKQNGWVLFWKDKEARYILQAGESQGQKRLRALSDAKREWNEVSLWQSFEKKGGQIPRGV